VCVPIAIATPKGEWRASCVTDKEVSDLFWAYELICVQAQPMFYPNVGNFLYIFSRFFYK
jgi:hypothetical protein